MAIATGVAETVVVWRARNRGSGGRPWATRGTNRVGGEFSWFLPWGLSRPVDQIAMLTRRHMHEYGTTREQVAQVAVKNHKHGSLNPKAQFQKEITLETVLKSPYVAYPLKLFDCCPFTDGGAAVVLAAEDVARGRPRAIWVLGTQAASDAMFVHDKRDLSRVPGLRVLDARAL